MVNAYLAQVLSENLYWTFQLVARGDKIAMGELASCNHDNYVHCKAPSATFHLDLGSHDILLHETLNVCVSGFRGASEGDELSIVIM
jgi:hypothetical protein